MIGPQRVAPRKDLPSFKPQIRAVEPLVLLGHLAQTFLAVISQLLAPFPEPSLDRILGRPQPPPRQRGRRLRQPDHTLLEPRSFGRLVLHPPGHGLLAALELAPPHLLGVSFHLGARGISRKGTP